MSNRKKILFVLPKLRGGGAERVNVKIINELDKSKFEITLFVFSSDECKYQDELDPSVRLVYASGAKSLLFVMPVIIYKLYKEVRKTDLVVAGLEMLTTYCCYLVSTLTRVGVYSWLHCNIKEYLEMDGRSRLHKHLIRKIYPRLSKVVCISGGAERSLKKLISDSNCVDCQVINNPISDVCIDVPRTQYDWGNKKGSGHCVVAAGTLNYIKGFDLLIKAVAKLNEQGVCVDLVIFGDGPERSALAKLINALDASSIIDMPGFSDCLIEDITHSDLFVLPSRVEGFGMVILESMQAGVPVLASDCPTGPRDIIGDNEYGMLVECCDVDALVKGIKLLLESEDLRNYYTKKGRERIKDYAIGDVIKKWEKLLFE